MTSLFGTKCRSSAIFSEVSSSSDIVQCFSSTQVNSAVSRNASTGGRMALIRSNLSRNEPHEAALAGFEIGDQSPASRSSLFVNLEDDFEDPANSAPIFFKVDSWSSADLVLDKAIHNSTPESIPKPTNLPDRYLSSRYPLAPNPRRYNSSIV